MAQRINLAAIMFVLGFAASKPGWADQTISSSNRCAIALVLAIDTSASVDMYDYNLQKNGFAMAFRHPQLVDAIRAQGAGIWVTLVHWSGATQQVQSVSWTRIHDLLSSHRFAAAIAAVPRPYNHFKGDATLTGTALGSALLFASHLFRAPEPRKCHRHVIDVSGDGHSNVGLGVRPVRSQLVDRGLTINGLAILTDEPKLDDYYRRNVIGGPSAFVMTVSTYKNFATSIRNKLLREIQLTFALHVP